MDFYRQHRLICVGNGYYCKRCEKVFKEFNVYREHQKICYQNIRCSECGHKCKNMEDLTQHKMETHRRKKHICWCGSEFLTSNALGDHYKITHLK